jgi:hypothetical protein
LDELVAKERLGMIGAELMTMLLAEVFPKKKR